MARNTRNAEKAIGDQIRKIALQFFDPEFKTKEAEKYKLVFSFDNYEYSTIFTFDSDGIRNGCIKIEYDNPDYYRDISSHIDSNSSNKRCFTPMLKNNLPPGVKQTDILQVLMSKLKFIYLNKDSITLIDNAHIYNPETKIFSNTLLSEWRLLRDEPSIYEKYGYISPRFNMFRRNIRTIEWQSIKDYVIPRMDKTLEDIWKEFFGDIGAPSAGEKIPSLMRRLSFKNVEDALISVPCYEVEMEHMLVKMMIRMESNMEKERERCLMRKKTIVHFIFDALKEKKGITPPIYNMRLTLHNNSELWQNWNARLVFLSFEQVINGGKRSKRSTRRSITQKNKHCKL